MSDDESKGRSFVPVVRRSHSRVHSTSCRHPTGHVMHAVRRFRPVQLPQSRHDLKSWLDEHLELAPDRRSVVFAAIDSVFNRHMQLFEMSKEETFQAISARTAYKIARLQRQLSQKDAVHISISQYLERLVADLT